MTWLVVGALTAFAIALALIAWRVLMWGVVGVVVSSVAGGIVGSAIENDPGTPMDWGLAYGLAIGTALGAILGLGWGTATEVWHRRRGSRVRS